MPQKGARTPLIRERSQNVGVISLREIRRRDELPDLEAEWRALEAEGGARTVFQTWAWNTAWLEGPGRNAKIRFLVETQF